MGRATRWLKGLFSGGNGEKKNSKTSSDVDKSSSAKEKKVWSFARSFRDKEGGGGGRGWKKDMTRSFHGSSVTEASSASPVGLVMGNATEQSKQAIAVAAATAAAAEAAVAAAQAAAAVVKLTSTRESIVSGWKREDWAAIKIQAVFRGYLARRALKALKGLVKLQALVRGHIVRKQAVETLRCMQALFRAQSRVRAGRTPIKGPNSKIPNALPTLEKYELSHVTSGNLGKCASKTRNMNAIEPTLLQSSGWSWLDRWMEERYWDSREAASRTGTVTDDEKNEKILEIDSGKPHLNGKWKNNHHSFNSSLTSEQNRRIHVTIHDSPSKESTLAQYSVPSPASVTTPEPTSSIGFSTEVADVSESPQYYSASSRTGSSMKGPFTPSKSECSLSYFSEFCDYPNYMSNTESFKAKVRSHSAPRQRPAEFEKSSSVKRSLGFRCVSGELSSSASQRSSCLHAKFTNKTYQGSGRLDRLGMPHGR